MGIFDALNTAVGGLRPVLRAAEHFRQHRERLDHRLQGHRHHLRGSDSGCDHAEPAGCRRRDRFRPVHHHHPGHRLGHDGRHQHGDQRRRLLLGAEADFAVVDNVPVFSGVTDYTRRGDFQVNANGNLVNGAGYYLMGVDVDPKTGNPTGNVPRFCNSRTTSSRRRPPARSNTPRTCRPSRRRTASTRRLPARSRRTAA